MSEQAGQEIGAGDPRGVPGDQPMSLVEHLESLRRHVLRGGRWFLIAFFLCFLAKDPLTWVATLPHRQTMEALGQPTILESLSYQETFLVQLKLSIFGGVLIGLPLILREIWAFIAVGLYPTERRTIAMFAPLISLAFMLGVLFGFFIMVPMGLRFLATYGDRELIAVRIRLSEYVGLFLTLTLALGLIFQLPLVMWGLARAGIFKLETYAAGRRYALLGAVIVGAVLTPPDVVTQLLMAGPLMVLYEVGIMFTGGWRSTLRRGRFLAVSLSLIVLLGAWLFYDLYRVDWWLDRVGTPGNELVWTGGGDRPYALEASGVAADLLELAERSAAPLAARARTDPRLAPLAVAAAARVPAENAAALREHAEDERGFVRDTVARALGEIGDPADDEILERLRTDRQDRSVQVTAAISLLARGMPAGGFTLIKTLEIGPAALAEEARQALVGARGDDAGGIDAWWRWYHATLARRPLGDRRALVEILEQLRAAGDRDPRRRLDVPAEIYGRLLEDEDAWIRFRAARLAPPDLLLTLASDPDPTVRFAAGSRLVELKEYGGIPLLIGLIEDRQLPVSRAAHARLVESTGVDLPEKRDSWEAWWRESEPQFRFR